jgi:Xaa-Pro aminopeptidase
MNEEPLLMVADSDRDANMLYAVGLFVPDPFIYLQVDGRPHIVLNDDGIDRARAKARHCRVHSLNAFLQRLRREGRKNPRLPDVIALILKENKIRKVEVPPSFPLGIARDLKKHGFKIRPRKGALFPGRELKSNDEVKKISAALTMAEVGLSEGIHALRNSKVIKGQIIYRGSPLTSERLRGIIDSAVVHAGGAPLHTIVAGGRQSCDPHEAGFGPLTANQPIILEVAPRSLKTGYFGKITRTVVKGKPSEAARALYHYVASGQEIAFSQLTDRAAASNAHQATVEFFARQNLRTRRQNGRLQGCLHHTGHGLGLDAQETPCLSSTSSDRITAGHVLSVAPGLYYSEPGGVRMGDVAYVTKAGARNLTKFEKSLEV